MRHCRASTRVLPCKGNEAMKSETAGLSHRAPTKWRTRYSSCYECTYCGRKEVVSWSPGWPPASEYFAADGSQLPGEVPCTSDAALRSAIDAELALDALEAIRDGVVATPKR